MKNEINKSYIYLHQLNKANDIPREKFVEFL